MVEPAFEKFSPDTVTTRTPFIAAVRRTIPASILKHFSPPGEQNAPVSDRRLMIGSSTKCTEAVSCQPSFSIFANTGSTTSATPSPEKTTSTAGRWMSRSSVSTSAADNPFVSEKPSESTPESSSLSASALAASGHLTVRLWCTRHTLSHRVPRT